MQLVAGMNELAGVLLEMHAADADPAPAHLEVAVDAHRQVVLADLVTLGQVGIHVVLAVELRMPWDLAAQRKRGLEAGLDGCLVRHWQHTWQAEADFAHVRVGRVAELADRAAAEHLGARAWLDMYLHTDHDLPRVRQPRPPGS